MRTIPIFLAFFLMGLADAMGPMSDAVGKEYQISKFLSTLMPFFVFIAFAVFIGVEATAYVAALTGSHSHLSGSFALLKQSASTSGGLAFVLAVLVFSYFFWRQKARMD